MSKPVNEGIYVRALWDRRERPTPVISRYTFWGGKRKTSRRAEDRKRHIFVDVYSTRLLIVILTLLTLSCLDAVLTLSLIEKGSVVEANPVMAFFLDVGVFHFSLIKFVITAVALIVLCVFKNVNITRIGLPVAIQIYLAVIIYEIYLYMS
ncbi:MAG: hypothetical protein C4526_11825 [Nitrospiraceae bacterium]|nr:MAG: hypothetical protein C4526_11825 [Nitrospiraceae bacterium]